MQMFAFYTAGYAQTYWWWEGVILIRKLGIIAFAVFVQDDTLRLYAVMWFVSCTVLFHMHAHPYTNSTLHHTETMSLATIVVTLNVALLLEYTETDSPGFFTLAIVMVLLNVLAVAIIVLLILLEVKTMFAEIVSKYSGRIASMWAAFPLVAKYRQWKARKKMEAEERAILAKQLEEQRRVQDIVDAQAEAAVAAEKEEEEAQRAAANVEALAQSVSASEHLRTRGSIDSMGLLPNVVVVDADNSTGDLDDDSATLDFGPEHSHRHSLASDGDYSSLGPATGMGSATARSHGTNFSPSWKPSVSAVGSLNFRGSASAAPSASGRGDLQNLSITVRSNRDLSLSALSQPELLSGNANEEDDEPRSPGSPMEQFGRTETARPGSSRFFVNKFDPLLGGATRAGAASHYTGEGSVSAGGGLVSDVAGSSSRGGPDAATVAIGSASAGTHTTRRGKSRYQAPARREAKELLAANEVEPRPEWLAPQTVEDLWAQVVDDSMENVYTLGDQVEAYYLVGEALARRVQLRIDDEQDEELKLQRLLQDREQRRQRFQTLAKKRLEEADDEDDEADHDNHDEEDENDRLTRMTTAKPTGGAARLVRSPLVSDGRTYVEYGDELGSVGGSHSTDTGLPAVAAAAAGDPLMGNDATIGNPLASPAAQHVTPPAVHVTGADESGQLGDLLALEAEDPIAVGHVRRARLSGIGWVDDEGSTSMHDGSSTMHPHDADAAGGIRVGRKTSSRLPKRSVQAPRTPGTLTSAATGSSSTLLGSSTGSRSALRGTRSGRHGSVRIQDPMAGIEVPGQDDAPSGLLSADSFLAARRSPRQEEL
jgi:hypothetical protein